MHENAFNTWNVHTRKFNQEKKEENNVEKEQCEQQRTDEMWQFGFMCEMSKWFNEEKTELYFFRLD